MKPTSLVKIIYASTSGNVELVCEYIAGLLVDENLPTKLFRAEKTALDEILNHDLFILATSTYEHGVINPYYDALISGMKSADLKGKYAGIVGLGDIRYEKHLFCEGAEILKRVFVERGGSLLHVPLKINGEPHELLGTAVADWTRYFIKALKDASE